MFSDQFVAGSHHKELTTAHVKHYRHPAGLTIMPEAAKYCQFKYCYSSTGKIVIPVCEKR
jgi:hypothetical protein